MLTPALVIASKEVVDGLRDTRSIVSSFLYALMGPFVVVLVSMSVHRSAVPGAEQKVLIAMMSVFTLVSTFVGGMNIAMDCIAGERERHSLLPLLLNPVRRIDVITGKWLAVSLFSAAGLAVNLAGFSVVFATAGLHLGGNWTARATGMLLGIFPLSLCAAALQLLMSTACRNVKEAHTYLSMVVFVPMGVAMFLVFFPGPIPSWLVFLPLGGQHLQLESLISGRQISLSAAAALGCFTLALASLFLRAAASRLERDAIIYGN